mmetsp:Transcript_3030/g.6068  ORF Transcript_3030/g.6068 Transcript_3030/m.6068 type:complete len:294 (-) Transcript_3030:199-1080(-)
MPFLTWLTIFALEFSGLTPVTLAFTETRFPLRSDRHQQQQLLVKRNSPPPVLFFKSRTRTHRSIMLASSPSSYTMNKGVVDEATMDETYDKLADQAFKAFQETEDNRRLWIAVVGAPGSGKTTIARNLVDRISKLGAKAISVPMDGYHFTQIEMKEKEYDMKRRGAPWTFDATRMYNQLKHARDTERSDVYLPDYSREISDPVADQIKLEESHDIVIIEGLYLALGALCPELDTPNSQINQVARELGDESWIGDELKRWEPMMQLWDLTMFVEPPFGFEENKRRLVERSLKTW